MLLFLLSVFCITDGVLASESSDSITKNWVRQLIDCNFRINDPSIRYPKFAKFCVKVYNWGDQTFNSYDTRYVVGTGDNWKFYGKNYNWMQSYAYIFDLFKGEQVALHTNVNSDFGLSLNFMAVSIGYTWNVNRIFTGKADDRKTFNFSFMCARFSAELLSWSTSGNTYITKFGDYRPEHGRLRYDLNDVNQKALIFNAYYFFNNKKYAQGAAYSYSKYQLRSAGTWLLGVNYSKQDINMDFSGLPAEMRSHLPQLSDQYAFHYNDYAIMGGYAYNAVLPHNWLYNITALPSVGVKRSTLDEIDESGRRVKNMLSLNAQIKTSITYNHRSFFAAGLIRFDGGFFTGKDYSFFNSMESFSVLAGIRF